MSGKIDYELSAHAVTVMAEREILEIWVARVLTNPERTVLDATDPLLCHALGRIPERDDRYCGWSTMKPFTRGGL